MRDPLGVIQQEFERSLSSPFRCLQHGDAWHNNCLFDNSEHGTKFALVDWQVNKICPYVHKWIVLPWVQIKLKVICNNFIFVDLLLWKCSNWFELPYLYYLNYYVSPWEFRRTATYILWRSHRCCARAGFEWKAVSSRIWWVSEWIFQGTPILDMISL